MAAVCLAVEDGGAPVQILRGGDTAGSVTSTCALSLTVTCQPLFPGNPKRIIVRRWETHFMPR